MDKRKLFIDFDSTIVNSIKRICEIYNKKYISHLDFIPAKWYLVEKWNFSDQCTLAAKGEVPLYFNRKEFFNKQLEFMDNAEEIINKLCTKFDVYVPSLGLDNNLKYKEQWLNKHFPYIKFIPCSFNTCSDKKHIDMSDGILIDDLVSNLESSNATTKICFGDIYDWNKNWNGIRCWNWYEIYNFLME